MSNRMKKHVRQISTLALAGLLLSSSLPTYAITYKDETGRTVTIDEFRDVQNHWARSIIREWNDLGVVNGDDKGNFNPNANITRGDLACIIDRLLGLNTSAMNSFNDLPAGKYYTQPVLRLNASGLLSGDGKLLRPVDNATREEVVCIIARAFKVDTTLNDMGYTNFVDDHNISSWARGSVKAMSDLGYVSGIGGGKFEPKRPITRAEVVAIIDKICESYYTKIQGVSDKIFTNNTNGNSVVAQTGLTLSRSTIGGNLYMTQSSNNLTLDVTEVKGDTVVLSNNGKLNVSESCVLNDLYLYGKTNVTGANMFSTIYVDRYASNSNFDLVPKKVVLEPNTSIKVKSTTFKNESSTDRLIYTENDMKNLMSEDKNKVEGGPEFSKGDIFISHENKVTAKSVALKTSGNSDLDEIGVIWNKSTKTPTIESHDGKEEYRGYNSNGVDFEVNNQRRDEYYTYRLYAVNENGLVGYSDPKTVRSYDFDIEMKVVQIGGDIRPEIHIFGDSVPKIKTVDFKYDYSHLYTEGKPTGKGKKDGGVEVNNTQDYQQYRFTYDIKLNDSLPPTHYGYVIEFEDAGKMDLFPILSNVTPENIKPVESIKTGNGSQSGSYISVRDNEITTSYIDVQEYGVVYRELRNGNSSDVGTPDATSSNWDVVREGSKIENKTTKKFSSSFDLRRSDSDVYFASYVKTADGYYYGDLKSIKNNSNNGDNSSDGDLNGPQVSLVSTTRLDNSTAVLIVDYKSESPLDVGRYGAITLVNSKNEPVTKYNGGSLNNADSWISLGKNKVALTFTGLQPQMGYTGKIQLYNVDGSKSGVKTFNISNNPITVSCNLDRSASKVDILNLTLPDNGVWKPTNATIDGNNVAISGTAVSGYSITTKSKLENGSHKLTLTLEYQLSKEQSNYKNIKVVRDINFNAN